MSNGADWREAPARLYTRAALIDEALAAHPIDPAVDVTVRCHQCEEVVLEVRGPFVHAKVKDGPYTVRLDATQPKKIDLRGGWLDLLDDDLPAELITKCRTHGPGKVDTAELRQATRVARVKKKRHDRIRHRSIPDC